MAADLCNRPRQDGQGYVSGALLGGYVWLRTTGGAFRLNARNLCAGKGVPGVPPDYHSPDLPSIRRSWPKRQYRFFGKSNIWYQSAQSRTDAWPFTN